MLTKIHCYQIVTELDGFDPRGNIKVLMATNRPDTLVGVGEH
jgi:ATP-dependent 26S proteasome regulatory subunit